jgi:hypothetical protein
MYSHTIFTAEYMINTQVQTRICILLHHLRHRKSFKVATIKKTQDFTLGVGVLSTTPTFFYEEMLKVIYNINIYKVESYH